MIKFLIKVIILVVFSAIASLVTTLISLPFTEDHTFQKSVFILIFYSIIGISLFVWRLYYCINRSWDKEYNKLIRTGENQYLAYDKACAKVKFHLPKFLLIYRKETLVMRYCDELNKHKKTSPT